MYDFKYLGIIDGVPTVSCMFLKPIDEIVIYMTITSSTNG